MNEEDLWGELKQTCYEENRTLDILKEQAELIKKKTDGLITGSCAKIEYTTIKPSGMMTAIKTISEVAGGVCKEIETDDKSDFNVFYNKSTYRFEISNDTYRFRIFTYDYSIEFPNVLNADEGICSELKIEHSVVIDSNQKIISLLSKILTCKKVSLVISRMISQSKNSYRETICKYIMDNPKCTIKQIAVDNNWSIKNTTIRINNLIEDGIIAKEGKGRKYSLVVLEDVENQ